MTCRRRPLRDYRANANGYALRRKSAARTRARNCSGVSGGTSGGGVRAGAGFTAAGAPGFAAFFAVLRSAVKEQDVRPLAIGIPGEIAAVMGWSHPYTLGVLAGWKMAPVYCRAVLCNDQRIALDGAPAEVVDAEAKDLAAKQLAKLAARKAAKKAAKPPARKTHAVSCALTADKMQRSSPSMISWKACFSGSSNRTAIRAELSTTIIGH